MPNIGSTSDISGSSVVVEKATNVKITHLSMATANTEYSHALESGVKILEIYIKNNSSNAQFCFATGETNTKYIPIPKRTCYHIDQIKFSSKTLYIEADENNQTAIIAEYY